MSKDLFKNPGRDIKELAEMIFWRLFFPWILGGAAIFILGCYLASQGDAEAGYIGWIGLLAGVVIIWNGYYRAKLKVILLYGYGVLVEKIDHLKPEFFISDDPLPGGDEGNGAPVALTVDIDADGTWSCPFCGNRNPARVKNCQGSGCGVVVDFDRK